METKTNVMRLLDGMNLPYRAYRYPSETALSGVEVADILALPHGKVFKTLVTVGKSKRNYVFVIPVALELDLKKAAQACGEKAIEMIKAKDLLPLTGYVHGGCSPIGMKKPFVTFVDASAQAREAICFSAGRIGFQAEMALDDLRKAVYFAFADLT
jgi:Cys-tRNA(Pro)/Cys-tRNA(Cys) deacylase